MIIRPFTRWLALAIVPFLVAAVVLLYLLPSTTDVTFAWTIRPDLTAMLLGSAYVGGIWFFLTVFRQRDWHRVRAGFPAVIVFATLLCLATFLHWDRFHHGHVSFVTWVTLYIAAPGLVAIAMVRNRGRSPVEAGERWIPAWLRVALAALGLASLLVGLGLFVAPSAAIDVWPWTLTPLTARVVGAILTLPGCVNLWLLVDGRFSGFRWLLQSQLISLAAILSALVVCRDDLAWGRPATLPFVAGLVLSLLAYAALYLRLRRGAPVPSR